MRLEIFSESEFKRQLGNREENSWGKRMQRKRKKEMCQGSEKKKREERAGVIWSTKQLVEAVKAGTKRKYKSKVSDVSMIG